MSGLKGMSKAQIQEAGRLADEQRLRYQQLQREQPVDSLGDRINAITQNMKDYWSEGTDYGKLLKAYGDVMAPINESLLKGMKMPYKENTEAIQKRERSNLPEMRPAGQLTPFTQSMTDPNYRFIAEIGADPLNLAGAPAVGRLAKKAVQATATSLAPKAGQMAGQILERQGLGPLSVVKKEGGNWIGETEKKVLNLKSKRNGSDPAELLAQMKERYTPEAMDQVEKTMPGFKARTSSQIQDLENQVAINKFVEKNMMNYVKKQMATPSDPVRLGIEARVNKAQDILNQKLQNNLQAREQKVLDAKAAGADPADIANLERDVSRYEQQIRQEYQEAVQSAGYVPSTEIERPVIWRNTQERLEAGYPEKGMATTKPSKQWEDLTDFEVKSRPVGSLEKSDYKDYPWLNKLEPDDTVHYITHRTPEYLGFDHMLDVLRAKVASGEINPEKLTNMSMDNLVQLAGQYEVEATRAAEKQAKEAMKANLLMNPHKEYPSGHKWVELPDPMASPENMKAVQDIGCAGKWCTKDEINALGYGGHYIDDSSQRLYTLIDPTGRPQVQISVLHENPKEIQWEINNLSDEARNRLIEKYTSRSPNWEYGNRNMSEGDLMREMINEGYVPDASIEQIKPVSNDWDSEMAKNFMEVNPKYREELTPYIQDFVKSRNWTSVRDLSNAKMHNVDHPEAIQKYGSPYLTQEEFDEIAPTLYKTPEMKTGGQVKDCGCHANMDAQRLAVWDKAERRGIGGRMAGKGARLLIPAMRPMDEVKMALELAHKSRARELQEAAGLYHGVGANLKTSKPVELMKARVIPNKKEPLVPEKSIGWEDIPLGSSIFSPPWDLSGVGTLTHVGGNKLSKPVNLQGGQLYQRTHAFPDSPELSSYTASQQGVVTRLGNLVRKNAEEGRDIFSIPMTMGHQGSDFNTMMTEAVLNQMDLRDLPESLKKELAHEIRTRVPNAKKPEIVPGKDFVGFDDPDLLRQQLLDPDSGELRKVFVNRLGLKQFQKSGQLPDIPETRFGIADPRLVNAPLGVSAFDISKVNPEGIMVPEQRLPHKTFKAQGSGEYFGTFDQGDLVKFQELYPEFIQGLRNKGKPTKDDWYTFGRSIPVKKFDQELLDSIKEATGANAPSITEYQDGGAVRKGGGGFMAKELAKRLAPKVLPIVEREANLVNKALTKTPKVSLPPENSVPAVNRLDMNYKDVTKRVPELTEAAKMVARGEMTAGQYDLLVKKLKPVTPYNFVPQPATSEDAMRALNESKRSMFGKTSEMTAGEQADLRLDIPAYKDHGVWVNSIHRKDQPTVYGSTSSVKNATMIGSPDKALKVAQGGPKAPFAVIRGEWNPMDEAMAIKNAQDYLNNPDWTQVGYDPERHGFFYDRSTMAPVIGADEVIQIGPLVLAKKPKYGNPDDFPFKKGGSVKKGKKVKQQVSLDAMRLAVLNKQSKDKRYG